METLKIALYALQPTLNYLRGALLPFSVSAVAMVLVATSLSGLDERLVTSEFPQQARFARVVHLFKLAHALPLLVAPAVAAGLLVYFAQDVAGLSLSVLQTPWTLAAIGFIQHVFIAYLLLEHVFLYSSRRIQLRRHMRNMPPKWRLRRAALWLQAMAPPLTFVFGVVILLQHAMLAAPMFLTTKNALVDARTFLEREGPTLAVRLLAAALIACAVAVGLVFMYWIGVSAGRLAVRLAAHPRFGQPTPCSLSVAASTSPKHRLWVVILSAVAQTLVSGAVLFMLGTLLWRDHRELTLAGGFAFLRATLVSPGVIAALAASILVWLLSVWFRSRRPTLQQPERLMVTAAVIAFTPSSVLASMALPMLTVKTQTPLLWLLLGTWAAAIAVFMFFHVVAEAPHPELVNLRLLKAGPARFAAGVLLGSFGALPPSALVVLYVLWIEDGLQATLRPTDITVTNLLYRSTDGRWSAASLLGILLGFVFWGTALVVVRALTIRRIGIAHWILDASTARPRRIGFAVISLLLFLWALPSLATNTAAAASDRRYGTRGHVITDILPAMETVRIREMIVDNDSAVELTVPAIVKTITIENLHFTSPKLPVIRFSGTREQILEQLSIRRLQYDVASRRDAVLQLSGLFIDDLQITGTSCTATGPNASEPRISVEMIEDAAIRRASLTCVRASTVDLAIGTKPDEAALPASITMVEVELVSARIHGPSRPGEVTSRPSGTIEISATMVSAPERGTPQLTLESLDWRGGDILLRPAEGEDFVLVSLTRVDRTGPTRTFLHLDEFPRTELRWEYGQIDGDVEIEAATFDNLLLDHLRPGVGENVARLKIGANKYNAVALANVAVDQLEILAAPQIESLWTIKTVQGVSVDERISIPKAFLESVLRHKLSPIQTRHFVTTLRDYGQYSDDDSLVGFDAVYQRKIIDLQGISPVAATLLDLFTGLGIRLRKPMVTWAVYTLAYLLISTLLIYRYGQRAAGAAGAAGGGNRAGSPRPTGDRLRALAVSCWKVVVSLLASSDFTDVANLNVRTGLIACRNLYRLCFLLQLAVISIFLGQTALN